MNKNVLIKSLVVIGPLLLTSCVMGAPNRANRGDSSSTLTSQKTPTSEHVHQIREYVFVDYPATYDGDGYTLFKQVCTICGAEVGEREVFTPALGHNYGNEWYYDSEYHYHQCIDPGYEYLRGGEAKHSFTISETINSSERYSYSYDKCGVCGYEYIHDIIDPSDAAGEENFEYEFNDEEHTTCTITKYIGSLRRVPVPSHLGGAEVTDIGWNAFGSSNMEELLLPPTVKNIAFGISQNSMVKTIFLPKTLESISNGAFIGCRNLENIIVMGNSPRYFVNDGVLFERRIEGDVLICYPSGREDTVYSIPSGITSIVNDAFTFIQNLKTLIIDNDVKQVHNWAISDSSIDNIVIGSGVENIEQGFAGHTLTKNIEVDINNPNYASYNNALYTKDYSTLMLYPVGNEEEVIEHFHPSITTIGSYAFSNGNYAREINLPLSITTIGNRAFMDCSNITNFEVPPRVRVIEEAAFEGCISLKSININCPVTELKYATFWNCFNLQVVYVSASVTSIAHEAFKNCNNLDAFYYYGDLNNLSIESEGNENLLRVIQEQNNLQEETSI